MKRIILLILLFGLSGATLLAQEICDNGIDDDGDGLIDLNDLDCYCNNLLESSLIHNPSFEEYTCCPGNFGELDCAIDWVQASTATSDYLNTCNFVGDEFIAEPPLPLPGVPGDGGFIGFFIQYGVMYKEYAGACLAGSMSAGISYTLNLWLAQGSDSSEIDLAIFGTPDCFDLPWIGTSCPLDIDGWTTLGTQEVTLPGTGTWQEISITFTPTEDINAVAIGSNCFTPFAPGVGYFFMDEIILVEDALIPAIESTGGWCTNDLILNRFTTEESGDWQWYKDGVALVGETEETLNPILYGPGVFTIRFENEDNCLSADYIAPDDEVEANFETIEFECNTTVSFINESISVDYGGLNWVWNFGDGEESTLENPINTYEVGGSFDVSLVAVSEDPSCNDTIVQTIYIPYEPESNFSFAGDGLFAFVGSFGTCTNNSVSFYDESTIDADSEIVEWFWEFGDGTTSNLINPVHSYESTGEFDVQLTVTSVYGCSNTSEAQTIFIFPLEADFTASSVCPNDTVFFTNTSDAADILELDIWEWDFGDGGTGSSTDETHIYTVAGDYEIELIGTTIQGCKDTATQTITIYPAPTPQINFEIGSFTHLDDGITGGCYPSTVNFSDAGGVEAPYVVTDWLWDFGDGETSTEENPAHLYASEGIYTVILSTVSDGGCEGSDTLEITMTNGLAILSADTTVCQNGTATLFTSSGDGSIYTYDWSIPGADDGNTQMIEDIVTDQWIYVSATSEYGCTSPLDSIFISVNDPIAISVTAPDTACLGEEFTVNVTATGGDEDYSYNWTANDNPLLDNTALITANPSISTIYCVTVVDGCESTPVDTCINVYLPETPSFTSDTTEGCEPTTITFTDETGPFPGLNESTWYIEDEIYTENPIAHTFTTAGMYTIKLDVLSPEGCLSTYTAENYVTIHPLPTPNLYATPNPTTYFDTEVQLVNISPSATSSFGWYMPGATETAEESDSSVIAFYPELISNTYDAYIIETTQFGCTDSTRVQIIVNNDQLIFASNAFTPNADGMNDEWLPIVLGANPNDYLLEIYNRWGELIWQTADLNQGWNGMYQGVLVKNDVYIWKIITTDLETDLKYRFDGMVTVVK